MTENEKEIKVAIEHLKAKNMSAKHIDMAIQALEEIQLVKEIISDFPLDCGSPVEDVREIYRQLRGFLQIGTIEEFKVLKEKSVAKKPIRDKEFSGLFTCPSCGRRQKIVYDGYHCKECGQKLDWSE